VVDLALVFFLFRNAWGSYHRDSRESGPSLGVALDQLARGCAVEVRDWYGREASRGLEGSSRSAKEDGSQFDVRLGKRWTSCWKVASV
jgi:hypothetical protein